MKILWFTNTPSLYKNEKNIYNGGGWIEALQGLITKSSKVELGISFFHESDSIKVKDGITTYYPIALNRKYVFSRLVHNWSCRIESLGYIRNFLEVIADYQPDVIHIFGTEGAFPRIQACTDIPVVVHLQGLLNPYNIAFCPPGISKFNLLFCRHFLKNHILGNSLFFTINRFEKKAKRELTYFQTTKYLMGRTKWDKSISKTLAPQATYFHIDEVLRSPFYAKDQWQLKKRVKTIIISTISSTIYKGLDLILRTAKLLKESTSLDFEWQVVGISDNDKLLHFYENHLNISANDFHITLRGRKTSDELIELLAEASVFVHPSYIDNSPNSVCEAQMLGLPVIACNVGGLPSLIENNVTGLLIPSNAPFELADAITTLAGDGNLSKRLGNEARLIAMKRHNREKVLSDILTIYETLSKK